MFAWRYLDEEGRDVGSSNPFEDQEAAETWLGQEWQTLRERGVEEVVLFDQQKAAGLYRMGLGEQPV